MCMCVCVLVCLPAHAMEASVSLSKTRKNQDDRTSIDNAPSCAGARHLLRKLPNMQRPAAKRECRLNQHNAGLRHHQSGTDTLRHTHTRKSKKKENKKTGHTAFSPRQARWQSPPPPPPPPPSLPPPPISPCQSDSLGCFMRAIPGLYADVCVRARLSASPSASACKCLQVQEHRPYRC